MKNLFDWFEPWRDPRDRSGIEVAMLAPHPSWAEHRVALKTVDHDPGDEDRN